MLAKSPYSSPRYAFWTVSFWEISRGVPSASTTVLLVEQNFQVASQLAERYVIIEEGISVHSGRMADLVQDQALITTYLGVA